MHVFSANGIAGGRATSTHTKNWDPRDERKIGEHNIINPELVPVEKIILPPLHIKLGVVKNFVKCLDRNGPVLSFLKTLFAKLSEAKIKEGELSETDFIV